MHVTTGSLSFNALQISLRTRDVAVAVSANTGTCDNCNVNKIIAKTEADDTKLSLSIEYRIIGILLTSLIFGQRFLVGFSVGVEARAQKGRYQRK